MPGEICIEPNTSSDFTTPAANVEDELPARVLLFCGTIAIHSSRVRLNTPCVLVKARATVRSSQQIRSTTHVQPGQVFSGVCALAANALPFSDAQPHHVVFRPAQSTTNAFMIDHAPKCSDWSTECKQFISVTEYFTINEGQPPRVLGLIEQLQSQRVDFMQN